MTTAKKRKDLENVARREGYFSTLAKKEAKGAEKRYKSEKKAGMKASAADSKREIAIDKTFAKKRASMAQKAKKQAARQP